MSTPSFVPYRTRYRSNVSSRRPAALEYARRLAQRGIPANALVRAYRLGQQTLLDLILTDIRDSDLEPGLGLDVFERMTTVTFRYVDWISQQVVVAYEAERDRWLENQNSLRAVRMREVLEASDVDLGPRKRGGLIRQDRNVHVMYLQGRCERGSGNIRNERAWSRCHEPMKWGRHLVARIQGPRVVHCEPNTTGRL
jgi:hypothetical protein